MTTKKEFKVTIREVSHRVVRIDAEDALAAIEKIKKMYHEREIKLTSDDILGANFSIEDT